MAAASSIGDEILKSRTDKRKYRRIVLKNSLVVLLISDPETDKCAASMNVSVGSFSDPEGLEGLAHFLEHMLFYASEKYPEEDSYSKYITEHGGSTNAYTSSEATNYHFNINTDSFDEALDRFAQFFIKPLMSADATMREIKAVDSEYQKNLLSDSWRMRQLDKHLSREDHPYHKFSTGNLDTLHVRPEARGMDTRSELIKFYDEHYSANIMHLVVYGKENLDKTQGLVEELFQDIRNTNKDIPRFPGQPCTPDHLQVLVKAVPIKQGHKLSVSWPVTPSIHHYEEAPCRYLGDLVGHEGEGSLFHALKILGWATGLYAGEGDWSMEYSFFNVSIDLTDAGHEHVQDILGLLFRHIKLLQQSGVSQWIFDELSAIFKAEFHYQAKTDPMSYAVDISSNMKIYPTKHWMVGSSLLSKFSPAIVQNVLDELSPNNVRILWESNKFEGETDKVEPWYNTAYSLEKITEFAIQEWMQSAPDVYLLLPTPNVFIPTYFSLKDVRDKAIFPVLLRKTPFSRLWYKPDTKFFKPKATNKLMLYNRATKEKEVFKPIDNDLKTGMYVCVSDPRAAVAFDILHRYLRHLGYEVNYVSNLTHFSDKLINQANKCEKNPSDFSSDFFEECLSDMCSLHCLLPTNPQPDSETEHMFNIKEMITKIIEKDFGYVVDGDVFFSVTKSPNYDHTQAAAECFVVDPKKRNPADFALWKATKPGEQNWESPWGPGRPGWDIGCSAMSTHYLSPRFEIFGGGASLEIPHHKHVIAQTCAACEDSGVTYWLHSEHVTNDSVEMKNSLDNSVTIRQIMAKYHPPALRHFLMSAHYRSPLKYSVLQLESSSDALVSVYQTLQDLTEVVAAWPEVGEMYNPDEKAIDRLEKLQNQVEKYLSDDLDTVKILKGALEDMMQFIRKVIKEHTTWKQHRLMKMVVSLVQAEIAVREVLEVLGLLTTHTYADFLIEMKSMALARVKLGAEEMSQDKIDLKMCYGTVKKCFRKMLCVYVELMEFITPAGNVVCYVRKSCASKSEASNECEVMSILRGSVGIVQSIGDSIHERSLHGSTFYCFFMEYAPAGTLYEEIGRNHRNGIPIDRVRSFTRMILQGLQSVHQAGYVHGDLHSGNILLFRSQEGLDAKITDFGTTKKIGDSSWWSKAKPHLGCDSTMSPESISDGTTKEVHDVWAVGLLVEQMMKKKKIWNKEEAADPKATDFMRICQIRDPESRPSVKDLLLHEFLQ